MLSYFENVVRLVSVYCSVLNCDKKQASFTNGWKNFVVFYHFGSGTSFFVKNGGRISKGGVKLFLEQPKKMARKKLLKWNTFSCF